MRCILPASLSAAVLATALSPPSASGTEADRARLLERLAAMETAILENDIEAQLGFMPPRLLQAMAGMLDLTVEGVRARLSEGVADMLARIRIEAVDMETAPVVVSGPGAGRAHAILRSEVVMRHLEDGSRRRMTTTHVALRDGGRWYVARLATERELRTLLDLYPGLRGIESEIRPAHLEELE